MRRAFNHPLIVFRDEITAQALCSGHVDNKGRSGACLLDNLHRKCLACPDLSALFGKDERGVKAFLSTMVNAYDGTYGKSSATQKTAHEHTAQFAFIGAVTPFGADRFEPFLNEIGPRLLMHRIPEMSSDERRAASRALRDKVGRATIRERLTTAVKAHLTALSSRDVVLPVISEEIFQRIEHLSEVIACGRGVVAEERRQIENTSRVFQVLTSFGQAVALVRGHAVVTEADIGLLQTITLGSIPEARATVLYKIAASPNGLTVQDVAGSDDFAALGRIRRALQELKQLGLAECIGSVGKGGADLFQAVPVARKALSREGTVGEGSEGGWGPSGTEMLVGGTPRHV